MSRKEKIDKIKAAYNITTIKIAKKIGVTKSQLYRWINNTTNKDYHPIIDDKFPLLTSQPLAHPSEAKKEKILNANDDEWQEIESPYSKKIDKKESKEPTTKKRKQKHSPSMNLRCPNDNYFMKITKKDYNRSIPTCPLCGNIMLYKGKVIDG